MRIRNLRELLRVALLFPLSANKISQNSFSDNIYFLRKEPDFLLRIFFGSVLYGFIDVDWIFRKLEALRS